jgi:hypothetical protein
MSHSSPPTLELRIPISPADTDMRLIRYLLESIQEFGGPIARAARCVVSVGADEAPRDLRQEYAWTADYPIEFRWVDRNQFRQWEYDATGFDRFWVESQADIVALIDADLLVTGDLSKIVERAYLENKMLGFMAHVSPFGFEGLAQTPSSVWWERCFNEAGLKTPNLDWQYSGWGLDWSTYKKSKVVSHDPAHRFGPPYLNYGIVLGPRVYFERMGETFVKELEAVRRVRKSPYNSQIANCLAFERHKIPCGSLSINYNFPLNLPGDAIRALNPDPEGENDFEDVRIFHYIGARKLFETPESVQALLSQTDLTSSWAAFQKKLRVVNQRIEEN